MQDIHNILEKLSQVTGVEGLAERYKKARSNKENGEENAVETEISRIRESLPNRAARSRFDKELRKQKSKHSPKKVKRSNLRLIARLRAKLSSLDNPQPKLIPAHLWLDCQVMIADSTGKAIREFSNMMSNKVAKTRIHRAALGIRSIKNIDDRDILTDTTDETDTTSTTFDKTEVSSVENVSRAYSYAGTDRGALRARRIFALGWLLVQLSHGTSRKGKYNRLVAGIPQAAFIGALRDPFTGNQVHRTTVSGHHRYEGQPGEIGYLDALKASDVLYTRQAKWRGDKPSTKGWEDIRPEEIAGERDGLKFSTDRYWIVTSQYTDPAAAAERARLWIDFLAGCQPYDLWLESTPVSSAVHGETSALLIEKPPD